MLLERDHPEAFSSSGGPCRSGPLASPLFTWWRRGRLPGAGVVWSASSLPPGGGRHRAVPRHRYQMEKPSLICVLSIRREARFCQADRLRYSLLEMEHLKAADVVLLANRSEIAWPSILTNCITVFAMRDWFSFRMTSHRCPS